jgi:hypothetical protein
LDVKDEIMRKSEKNGENIILLREVTYAKVLTARKTGDRAHGKTDLQEATKESISCSLDR